MTILITGGTGKTGSIIANLLSEGGHSVLITSRKGVAPALLKAVKFDWFDPSTFEAPFAEDSNIDRVYLVAPFALDLEPIMKPFIDLAIAKGVKGFVLLSGSREDPTVTTGPIRRVLVDSGIDYAVLSPSWFQENFGTSHCKGIRERDEIVTSTGDGEAAFVSTRDIALAAVKCLTADRLGKKVVPVYGPELFSFDEAAKLLSSVIGRKITHRKISADQMLEVCTGRGLPEDIAKFIVYLEQGMTRGDDRELFERDDAEKIIGKRSLLEYFTENRELWIKT